MRGAIQYLYEGLVMSQDQSPMVAFDMGVREFCYWNWRVSHIRVDVSAQLNTKAMIPGEDEEKSGSYTYVDTIIAGCPVTGSLNSQTELEQLTNRQQYSNSPGLNPPGPPGIGLTFFREENMQDLPEGEPPQTIIAVSGGLSWGGFTGHFGTDDEIGYVMWFEANLSLRVPKYQVDSDVTFTTNTTTGSLPFGGVSVISGADTLLGGSYLHSRTMGCGGALYTGLPGSVGATSADCFIRITPFFFYEWADNGVPLYNYANGTLA